MATTLLDANAMLRYLLEDIPEQAMVVEECIAKGAEVTIEVLAECAYVLSGVYGVPRSRIAESFGILLDEVACQRHRVAARGGTFSPSTSPGTPTPPRSPERTTGGAETAAGPIPP